MRQNSSAIFHILLNDNLSNLTFTGFFSPVTGAAGKAGYSYYSGTHHSRSFTVFHSESALVFCVMSVFPNLTFYMLFYIIMCAKLCL